MDPQVIGALIGLGGVIAGTAISFGLSFLMAHRERKNHKLDKQLEVAAKALRCLRLYQELGYYQRLKKEDSSYESAIKDLLRQADISYDEIVDEMALLFSSAVNTEFNNLRNKADSVENEDLFELLEEAKKLLLPKY